MSGSRRDTSTRSRAAGLMIGATTAGMLAVASPAAGLALAHEGEDHHTPSASGDAVGRTALDNPAPGVRITQAFGDKIYNRDTALNRGLDDSAAGQNYHKQFGYAAGQNPDEEDGGAGSNGTKLGLLNSGIYLTGYNALQEIGVGLPDEKDLPGTVIRGISGKKSSSGGSGHYSDEDEHGTEAVSLSGCTDTATSTTLSCADDPEHEH